MFKRLRFKRGQRDTIWATLGLILLAALAIGRPVIRGRANLADRPQVRIAFFPNLTHAPALVGVSKGFFASFLTTTTLSTRVVNAGPEAMEALLAGAVDFAYVGPSPAINTYIKSNGKALHILAGACDGGASLIRRGDVPIASIRDLDGKRVAVPQFGGTQDVSLRTFLAQNGLSPREKGGTVDILPIKNPDILSLFKQKQLDAAWVPEPWASRLKHETGAQTVVDERDLWPSGKFTTTVLVVRTAFATAHPDIVNEVLAAHLASVRWIQDSPAAAKQAVNQELKKLTGKALTANVLNDSWNHVAFSIEPDRESIQLFAEAAYKAGYSKNPPTGLADLVDDKPLRQVQRALVKAVR
jgi:NitT/TauT family transport system substrate-binding protein